MTTAWSFSRINNFETCPKKYWHTMVAKDVREKQSAENKDGKDTHKALELRVRDGVVLPKKLQKIEPYAAKFASAPGVKHTELQIAIDESFRPTLWFDKSAWGRSVIDLAIVNGKKAVIVDYKTGKPSYDFTQQKIAAAFLMLSDKAIEKVQAAYLWIQNKTFPSVEVQRADMRAIWADLLPRIRTYEKAHTSTTFPPKPSGLCRKHCPVTQCPHNGGTTR